jgi:hypothetical protein
VFYYRTVFASSTVFAMPADLPDPVPERTRTFQAGPVRIRVGTAPPEVPRERLSVTRIVDEALSQMRKSG